MIWTVCNSGFLSQGSLYFEINFCASLNRCISFLFLKNDLNINMEDCSGTRGQCGRPCRLEISLVTLGGDSGYGDVHEGTQNLLTLRWFN